MTVADPECARGGGVRHILAEKRVLASLLQKMHENVIFSPIRGGGGGVRRVRPMLDPPLNDVVYKNTLIIIIKKTMF